MSKFKVLKYNQSVMARIGIYPNNIAEPTNSLLIPIAFYYVLFNFLITVISSAVLISKNLSDFKIVIDGSILIVGSSQCFGEYFFIGLKMNKAKALHLDLQDFVDEGMIN